MFLLFKLKENEPDLVIFEIKSDQLNCYIIELKDGNVFDTKKSDAEHDHLKTYKAHLGSMIPFITNFFICCFNQLDKNIIVEGFKKRFSIEETMTGKELCDLLGISYEEIIEERKADAIDNVEYFVEELNKITAVRMMIKNIRNRRIDEESFYSDEIDIDQ